MAAIKSIAPILSIKSFEPILSIPLAELESSSSILSQLVSS